LALGIDASLAIYVCISREVSMFMLRTKRVVAAAIALTLGGGALQAGADEFINVLTGGTSGVYYPLGVALSNIYGKGIQGSHSQVQATKASVENLNLLQQGKGEVAFTLGDSLQLAWQGNADAGFPAKLDKLRGIAAIYPNYIQIVASKESGIQSLADLKGKSLSVGAPKSGTELNARAVLAAAGLSYADLGKVEYLPFAESVELIKNRQLDATLQSAGLGVASIRDLATSLPITVVAVPADVVAKVGAPYFAATIPAGTYEGQTADVATAAVGNFLVTRDGVSDDTAYQMTRLLFENLDQLAAAHAAAKAIDPAKAVDGMPIPLHPGAERYYREKGLIK
jgi:TRAP transporter TAXI family solute receptor